MFHLYSKRETCYSKKPRIAVTAPPGRGAVFNEKNETFLNCQRAWLSARFCFSAANSLKICRLKSLQIDRLLFLESRRISDFHIFFMR